MDELEERIVAFVAKATGTKPQRIRQSSRLAHDIGIDGDDAIEFFEKFSKEFKIDLNVLQYR